MAYIKANLTERVEVLDGFYEGKRSIFREGGFYTSEIAAVKGLPDESSIIYLNLRDTFVNVALPIREVNNVLAGLEVMNNDAIDLMSVTGKDGDIAKIGTEIKTVHGATINRQTGRIHKP